MITLPPLSLYIHIPWCFKKCPYCDFNTYVTKNKIPEKEYIRHLILDLKKDINLTSNRIINSIFIGGGTPSLFHYESINMLLKEIKKCVYVSPSAEITIETNPKDIEYKKILKYKEIGITRLSIGIQTFNEKKLHILSRDKEYIDIPNIKTIIHDIKFKNVNFDIMYGLPSQSLKNALSDLKTAISLNPHHISWYQLTIEPNTIFYSKKLNLPNSENMWKIWKEGRKLLTQSGYQQYEISSYAKKGYYCKHNINYWKYGDYVGIGCGAHGKLTQKNGSLIRVIKNKGVFDFINGKYINKIYKVKDQDKPFEYFMNTLRLFQPTYRKNFVKYTFLKEKYIKKNIESAISQNYLQETLLTWKTTKKGKLFLNNLLEIFLHD
ncbi:radical SAM family heme chaperone HemW [Buchnera aphidicola (Pemphigus obesinymphae)]|uniref:radical SAM family heme chaperone HemW n=1 Tax=Buchnera aphidicola TaxID=9 RepID=UPI0022388A57|nr:radical SAM family heme chaperone HemW [Buchnera aphidicola]MCW5196447.1 radical SAM family heme chaperone HemW [Buchnera aphidicola (Pemphigus obesinymphae)]